MTWLTRLIRTTAFKLSLLYLVVFTALSGFLLIYLSRTTNQLMAAQVVQTVDAEIRGLSDEYLRGGVRALVESMERRARQPDASLYLLMDFAGNPLVGNISRLPTVVLEETGSNVRRMRYTRSGAGEGEDSREALVRIFELRGGYRVLVGRDLGEQQRFATVFSDALQFWLISVILMAGATWFFVSQRVMKRIDGMAATSRTIMEGDLSRRLPIAGNGDEFDRLASNLNDMLDRIELLMQGMREVTDNIAHDLKTPLTRLRTRVETALRESGSEAHYREALEGALDESDGLLRIFDALLRIARVEAMSPEAGLDRVDLGALVEELADLYQPVLEDEGGTLTLVAEPGLAVMGNRELIAQGLVNLIENSLKYGRCDEETAPQLEIGARREGDRIAVFVRDHGPGIDSADLDRVSDRFVRLDKSRTKPGYGLGLSLVNAIAKLHGGQLRLADAAPGLRAELDLKPAPAAAAVVAQETNIEAERRKGS
ncbi:sensor histidine kinase [Roseibium aestuarii]|uniref:histidine kinase n=1 Tax=Roseibium aestuarii TaxID=2600299 RepID=A0ABW4JUL5_9HYPH|nr:HAMP domain-containing sensor histidine kinase [Roseibium aestuarii]